MCSLIISRSNSTFDVEKRSSAHTNVNASTDPSVTTRSGLSLIGNDLVTNRYVSCRA